MKEKLLALLKTKLHGVEDAILLRIAEKRSAGVTDEDQLQTIADGIGFSDVLNSYGDFRANGAVTSAVTNYEKKYGLKDGKPIQDPNPIQAPKLDPNPKKDEIPGWAQQLIDQTKAATDSLAKFQDEKKANAWNEKVMAKAKEFGIPETQAKRYAISEGTDLDVYFKDVKQELSNLGITGTRPPETAEQQIKTEAESFAAAINKGTEELIKK